jgi:hypothetical protein
MAQNWAKTGVIEMRQRKFILTLFAASVLSGCGGSTIYKQSRFGDLDVLSVDAKQRLVIQGDVGGQRIVCTEPSPDAIVAQAAQFAAAGAAPVSGGNASAKLAGGFSESAGSIGLRTQTIQLLRDGYFRLCEARLNNQITNRDYQATLYFIDEFIATVAAIESLGGIVQAPPITISSGGVASISDTAVSSTQTSPPSLVQPIKVNTVGIPPEAAKAIQEILKAYYKRKWQYQEFLEYKKQSG